MNLGHKEFRDFISFDFLFVC